MLHNFTYIQENLVAWSLQGYVTVLGYFFLPLIFCIISGYVYLNQRSATAAAIAILLLFSVFGGMLLDVDLFNMLMQIIVALIMTALVLIFLSKRRQ